MRITIFFFYFHVMELVTINYSIVTSTNYDNAIAISCSSMCYVLVCTVYYDRSR